MMMSVKYGRVKILAITTIERPMRVANLALTVRALAAPVALGLITACAQPRLFVEVLPPRASVTCGAPSVTEPASARGLLDLAAIDDDRGAYLADLRFSVTGSDAEITAVEITGAGAAATASGRLALLGSGDDIRRGVLEDVQLVSRAAAQSLRDDRSDLGRAADDSIELSLTPVLRGNSFEVPTATFTLDLCEGCLVRAVDNCAVSAPLPSCRPGQDLPSITCVTEAAPE
jgi:hypothetical protein